jgi:hypothetical protein
MAANRSSSALAEAWPHLTLDGWQDTYATLQLWTQMVGKTRLKLAPMLNHWWHVTLHVTARGLRAPAMPAGERDLEIEFDFIDHQLVARTSDGRTATLPLVAQPVADFYAGYLALLRSLDVEVRIWPVPSEVANPIPFLEDRVHSAYDPEAAQRCWRALVQVDRVLNKFRSRFLGKCSPSHFWWGGFDISCTRFSGRAAPTHPGGIPNLPDWVTREAYSHECISAGWWPGGPGWPIQEPVFYAYAYPEPPGCPEAMIRPEPASYHAGMREWILPYEAVLRSPDRDAMLLEFLQSTYETAATLGGWDRALLERPQTTNS